MPAGGTFLGQTFNLTATDATTQFLNRTIFNFNNDAVTETIARTVDDRRINVTKSINQPSMVYNGYIHNMNQNGAGTLGGLVGIRSQFGGTGTGAVTSVVSFLGNGSFSNTYAITSYTGLDLQNTPINSVTNSRGIVIGELYGSAISRAIDSNVSSGTNKYNIYAQGTAANYFAGNIGIGASSPTAFLNLKAGLSTASNAPLKFTAGTNLTTAEAGAVEFDGTNWYGSPTAGNRKTFAFLESPTFTGTPTAPTATAGTNTTQIATTAFVQSAVSSGTYTPTLTNTTNITSSAVTNVSYIRVGNVVTVTVGIQITPTTTALGTILNFTFPFARATTSSINIGNANLSTGSGVFTSANIFSFLTTGGYISFNAVSTTTHVGTIQFQYNVLD
jgi:hypothetical protein